MYWMWIGTKGFQSWTSGDCYEAQSWAGVVTEHSIWVGKQKWFAELIECAVFVKDCNAGRRCKLVTEESYWWGVME